MPLRAFARRRARRRRGAGDAAPVSIEPGRMEHPMQIARRRIDACQPRAGRRQFHEDRLHEVFGIRTTARQRQSVPEQRRGMAVVERTQGLRPSSCQVREQLMIATIVADACHSCWDDERAGKNCHFLYGERPPAYRAPITVESGRGHSMDRTSPSSRVRCVRPTLVAAPGCNVRCTSGLRT